MNGLPESALGGRSIADYVKHVHNRYFAQFPLFDNGDNGVVGYYLKCWLASVFQPVVRAADDSVTGHEAFVNVTGLSGLSIPSKRIFNLTRDIDGLVQVDRLCRTLHTLNYFVQAESQQLLFLSVQPQLLTAVKDGHGKTFEEILGFFDIPTSRIVIDVPTAGIYHNVLKRAVTNWQSHGFRIAINCAGEKDIDKICSLNPDIVVANVSLREELVALRNCIEKPTLFLIRKIATAAQARIARAAGADLLQGCYIGGLGYEVKDSGTSTVSNVQQESQESIESREYDI